MSQDDIVVEENSEDEVVIPPKIETHELPETEEVNKEVETPEAQEPFKAFETEEEYKSWEEEQKAKIANELSQRTNLTQTEAKAEAKRIFDDGWKPKNWNDLAEQLLNNPVALQKLQEKLIPETQRAIEERKTQEREEMEEINKGFDNEYNALAKKGLLPPLNTEEGKKINEQISTIGANYNQTSITKAYELWKKIPTSEGGGLEYVPPAKAKLNAQKQRAGLVGSPKGSTGPAKKGLNYKDIHTRSLDDIIGDDV